MESECWCECWCGLYAEGADDMLCVLCVLCMLCPLCGCVWVLWLWLCEWVACVECPPLAVALLLMGTCPP